MKRNIAGISIVAIGIALTTCLIWAQQAANIVIPGRGEKPTIAVPDFRGSGVAQPVMDVFNQTLFRELQDSGQLKMAPKTVYPLNLPQQPSDFKEPVGDEAKAPGSATGPARL